MESDMERKKTLKDGLKDSFERIVTEKDRIKAEVCCNETIKLQSRSQN
jgi:hypothetical protein